MADDMLALADLLLINDQSIKDLEITDLLNDAPLLAALAAEPASHGTVHKYTKETGAPVVGFRSPNAGRDLDSSIDTQVSIDLKILDASFGIDKAIADAYQRGGPAALIARELKRHLKAAFFAAENQIINGATALGDAGGFVGLRDAATLNGLNDTMVYNAAGAAAESGDTLLTSVYMFRSNPDGSACCVIAGNEGKIVVGDTVEQLMLGSNSKSLPAYTTSVLGWLGFQIGSAFDVGRIANISVTDGETLNDDMLGELFSLFPSNRKPTHIAMNRRSRKQLQQSRTATNPTGAPAPFPSEWEGIPIIGTDAITNNEPAVS